MEKDLPYVVSINVSLGGIPKLPVESIFVGIVGLNGDGHNHEKHCTPFQAISLQDIERLDEISKEGISLSPGATGENLTVAGLNVNELPIGTILRFSGGLIIEITKIRKPCYVLDSISPQLKEVIVGRCGMYAKVLNEALLSQYETIERINLSLITL